ncbi:hypothetical protein AVEN_224974-1 [Araneus ventricosus]|uniref:Uncharacterized protein n=1 Tax=Araneus ventricosus TaxID=182803 RepID=A0A4Y2NGE0_ARAVE|nr:hypothetical protein AVEN_224974-1 [Araneus ventricosus]
MGNLTDEERTVNLTDLESHVELKQHFKINLILTEFESKCRIALALAPSRIAIGFLDGDSIAHSPLQLSLILLTLRILYAMQAKGLIRRLIVQQIANLSFGMSVRCQINLPLSCLFLHGMFWKENSKQSFHTCSKR